MLAPATLLAHPPDVGTLETLVSFNPQALETPESLVVDRSGTIYISLALTGEIRKIAPNGAQTTLITLPIGPPLTVCGPFFAGVTGIAQDPENGTLYAAVAACDAAFRGIWRISPNGHGELIAKLPLASLPNGIALEDDVLYVADTSQGIVWRVPAEGGAAEIWLDHPLLKTPPGAPAGSPGPNGIRFSRVRSTFRTRPRAQFSRFPSSAMAQRASRESTPTCREARAATTSPSTSTAPSTAPPIPSGRW